MILDPRQDLASFRPFFRGNILEWISENLTDKAMELVLDYGNHPEIRNIDGSYTLMSNYRVTEDDIDLIVKSLKFSSKTQRAVFPGSLVRCSGILNLDNEYVGVTIRFAKLHDFGFLLKDILKFKPNILILGAPGKGKTSILRSIAIANANDIGLRTIIVDKSNEIAGDDDALPADFGRCRRIQVPNGNQYGMLIQAVENHTPESIVVDEISDAQECFAIKSIAERGVQVIATAHGDTLINALKNPAISKCLGGVKSSTLGDDEMHRRELESKTIVEREFPSSFSVVIEIVSMNQIAIHHNAERSIDYILRNEDVLPEIRQYRLAEKDFVITQTESFSNSQSH